METVIFTLIVVWMGLHSYNHYQKEKILMKTINKLEERISSIE